MALSLSEDDVFRSSTQYRLWSFTPEALAEVRAKTNSLAAVRAREAMKRLHPDEDFEVDCLTVDEEQTLVRHYCQRALELAEIHKLPTNVKATAVQYLKRFYLSNSPMTYHPKDIMLSALFFATKTDNHYISLKKFVEPLQSSNAQITTEKVIAPEFLLTQGLRFNFDVRHPHRGLEGGFMELQAMAHGQYDGPPGEGREGRKGIAEQMALLPGDSLSSRLSKAYQKASHTLKTSAILSDAYFLYTPSQIWVAALLAADEALAKFYLKTILVGEAAVEGPLLTALKACASMLRVEPDDEKGEELKRLGKKLHKCQNPEKADIAELNRAQKRDGDNPDDEKAVKKRKLEREKMQKEDPFGPSIKK